MDIVNLRNYVGLIIKNYKELCIILDENVTSGEAKKAQLKEFNRFFKYDKEGHKFKVVEIYDKPLDKIDNRSVGNNSKYLKYIEMLLKNYLTKQDEKCATLTRFQWMLNLGMVNSNYGDNVYKSSLVKNETNSYNLNNFMARSNSLLKSTFFDSLNNMVRRKLISYVEQVVIVPCSGDKFIAGEYELCLLQDIEKEVMEEMKAMGYKTIGSLIYKGLYNEYNKRIQYLLMERYEWYMFYKQFYIELLDNNLYDCYTDNEINIAKMNLNSSIIDSINANALHLYEKHSKWEAIFNCDDTWLYILEHEEKTGEVGMPLTTEPFRYNDDYVDEQTRLSEKLLRVNLSVYNV